MSFGTEITRAAEGSIVLLKEKAPLILTISSIGLGVTSTYMAIKVTPEAYDIHQQIVNDPNLSKKEQNIEIAKNVLPLYGPAALTGGLAIAAGIASYKISDHRLNVAYEKIAGLSTLYIATAEGAQKYKNEIIKKFGEKVHEEVTKDIAEEDAKKEPEKAKDIILANDDSKEIMQDSISGQYFKNTRDNIYFICKELQKRLYIEDRIAASEYFYEAEIDNCNFGDEVGWLNGDEPWPKFTEFILPDGRKAVRVEIDTNPRFAAYNNYY